MDAELQRELRALERRLSDNSANERDLARLEGEIEKMKAKNVAQDEALAELREWKAARTAAGAVEAQGAAFWKGLGGKVLGAVLVTLVLGGGSILAAVWAMLQQAGG